MLMPAFADGLAGLTGIDPAAFEGLAGEGAGGDDCIGSDTYARAHERAGSDPDAIFQRDRRVPVTHIGLLVIVVARTQKASLRQAAMSADDHGSEIDDVHFFSHPSMISDLQLPRNVNVDPWFPIDVMSNASAKKPQEPCFKPRRPGKGR